MRIDDQALPNDVACELAAEQGDKRAHTAAIRDRYTAAAAANGTTYDEEVQKFVKAWRIPAEKFGDDHFALAGLGRRLSVPNHLASAGEDLRRHYDGLRSDFEAFFPELQAHVTRLKAGA